MTPLLNTKINTRSEEIVTVSSPSEPKCGYPFCVLSIHVEEYKNKGFNTKFDNWLHYLCQINHDGKSYNNKYEDKICVRKSYFTCYNSIMFSLDKKILRTNHFEQGSR